MRRRDGGRRRAILLLGLAAAAGCSTPTRNAVPPAQPEAGSPASGLVLQNLLSTELELAEDVEVIVSRVTIPPETALPRHWHPGEEFGYVLSGAVTLWQEGAPNVEAAAGDVVKVPLRRVHTAITGAEGVELLVFRVHERGQPHRILVEG